MPGYAVQWIEIEGPFYDDPAGGAGYRLLFDRLQLVPSKQARTGVPLEIGPSTPAGPGPAAGGGSGGGAADRGFGASPSARRPMRSSPRRRGRTPSGCCGRS